MSDNHNKLDASQPGRKGICLSFFRGLYVFLQTQISLLCFAKRFLLTFHTGGVNVTPSRVKSIGLKSFFYGGDASLPSVQAEIKENFTASLKETYSEQRFCNVNPFCTDENIELIYNPLTGISCFHDIIYISPVYVRASFKIAQVLLQM